MDRVSTAEMASGEPVEGVHLRILAAGDRMNVQHFRIEPGATVPEHSHHHEQLGYVISGTITFLLEDRELTLEAGDSYALEGEEPHGVENRGEEVVEGIDIFAPPRTDPDWAD